ncbi:MAG TPA: BON domain-containing protein [Burkholderiales bacterium]|nr:BON domain-containing protein [Burkholderiales bacterium]
MRKLITVSALALLPILTGCVAAVVGGAAASGYLIGEDRRSAQILSDDQAIETRVGSRVGEKHPGAHVNTTSYNRLALLTGEAPTAEAKADIEKIAREVPNVRGIFNELTVAPPTAMSVRANDAYVTSKVKARFVDARKFNPIHVKVVTEDSTVFLMGVVKQQEATDATEVARTTSGVRRVVRLFEIQG